MHLPAKDHVEKVPTIENPPQTFFGNKNRAFWNLQSAGWIGALILNVISGFANGQPSNFLIHLLISTIVGYSISLALSVVYRNLIDRRPVITWSMTTIVLLAATGLYAFIDAWSFSVLYRDIDGVFGTLFLGMLFRDFIILAAWSALYYAINFFLRVEEQADQLQLLEAHATSSQLAMLRYQLNPHFLFNTLNSISTLVLLKETERANAMLSRLSGFLRYTLINETTGQVTVMQEVETLKLYLEIEQMRFEERLRTSFQIDPAVTNARLPSLLLQPLVENAIKYAVTPKEDGADINISARLVGEKLRIVVSDTGPGLNEGLSRPSLSTGVGLANIRNRLIQTYGEDQRLDTMATPGGGFSVTIELPYYTEKRRQN